MEQSGKLLETSSTFENRPVRVLLVPVPDRQWKALRRGVVFPPLLVGGCTALAVVVLPYVISAKRCENSFSGWQFLSNGREKISRGFSN